jgi:hypothetical protein
MNIKKQKLKVSNFRVPEGLKYLINLMPLISFNTSDSGTGAIQALQTSHPFAVK